MAKLSVEQALSKAKSHTKKGELAEAKSLYAAILKAFPNNKMAQQGLMALDGDQRSAAEQGSPPPAAIDQLMRLYRQGQLELVVDQAQDLIAQFPKASALWNMLGASAAQIGRLDQAAQAFREMISLNPNQASAHYNLGNALKDQGKLEEAIEAYNNALSIKPDYEAALNNVVIALKTQGKSGEKRIKAALETYNRKQTVKTENVNSYFSRALDFQVKGKLDEAIEAYRKVLAIKPDYADALLNMGVAFQKQDQLDEAIEAYNKALAIKPDYADAYYNMAAALQEQGQLDEAIEAYKKALAIKPDYALAYYNMGLTFREQGQLEEAIEAYRKVLVIKPDYADAYNNMGVALQEQGQLDEAIEAYNKALTIKPDYADAYLNLGNALQKQGQLEEAIEVYNKALTIKPDYAVAYYNMGNALKEQDRLQEAIETYNKALAIKPDNEEFRAAMLHQKAHICDWDSFAKDIEMLPQLGTTKEHVSPFAMLSLEDAPERHRIRAKIYAAATYPQRRISTWARPSQKPKRLRIGYFSADFHNFPGMYLMAGLLEKHDRTKFEISAFSYGPDSDDPMRRRIINAVDHFIDIKTADTSTVIDLARQKDIDIAIHRNGYTKNDRTELFASGVAPVQINYLGYPGTLGADFMDYIVADPVVIPDDTRRHYSEQIIYLPNTYQPNDDNRNISDKTITREEMGLPECAFVFCCFNQNYKISPIEFDIWMRLLGKVKGSVLWLLKSNKWAERNLKRQAESRGVSPERIIFAERMPQAEHLARHRLADLFIDTFNYNAHTTTSDALWAGLPVVTKLGQGFAARVAGSLLNAIGLPELVTTSEREYEEVILELATNSTKLAHVKDKLATNRLTQPLFDTELYTKHLENGYQQAYQNYFDGKSPKTIIVPR